MTDTTLRLRRIVSLARHALTLALPLLEEDREQLVMSEFRWMETRDLSKLDETSRKAIACYDEAIAAIREALAATP